MGTSDTGSGGAHFAVTTLLTLLLDTSLHTHLAIGICTKMSSASRSIPSPSSAPAAHWWYRRLAHGFSTPNMTLIPPHASRIRLVTVAENSSRRSYRSAQNSVNAPASVMSVSGSRNFLNRSSATVENTLYAKRLHASTPAPGLDKPITIRAPSPAVPACTVAHTCIACSLMGTRVSIITPAPPAHTSTAPCPYWLIPSNTFVIGWASAGLLEGAISRASSDRLCQNTAPASSRLSKKSSSAYTPSPQLASTEWYSALPGTGQRGPALHTATSPGVYVIAYVTNRTRNTPALSTSAANVPTLGSRCMAGHSAGISVGIPDEAGSVCHTVPLTRMVAGLSQYVLLVAPGNSPVVASHPVTWLDSSVTAMLSSFRYSRALMLTLNTSSHSRPNDREKPSNVTNLTRSCPHE